MAETAPRDVVAPHTTIRRTPRRTAEFIVAGLLAALLAASALISIPIGAVPVTLQTFVLAIVALISRPRTAAFAVGAYLLLGTVGLPIFAGGLGGPGVLLGPTGGYLVGFLVGAIAAAAGRRLLQRHPLAADLVALGVLLVGVYLPGTVWLAHSAGLSLVAAASAGVVPFVGLDALKGVAALGVAAAVRRSGLSTLTDPSAEAPS